MVEDKQFSTMLKKDVQFSGPTLFTGQYSSVKISTSPTFDGIYFKRIDITGSAPIKASLENVYKTQRTTILGSEKASIILVEHLLSVLYVLGIKKALIEVEGPEIPIGDGSAMHIIQAIFDAGVEYSTERVFLPLDAPISFEEGKQSIVAVPAKNFTVSYVLNYPGQPLLESQTHEFTFGVEEFIQEIAPCRTFALKAEVDFMMSQGFLKGNSLNFGVVIDQGKVLNPGGLRFHNEMARHKILDFLGDFALADLDLSMHNISLRSGHQANIDFAKKITNHLKVNSYGS